MRRPYLLMKRNMKTGEHEMKKLLLASVIICGSLTAIPPVHAQTKPTACPVPIKTRLDHLSGTPMVVVISCVSSEITSITCKEWTMLGLNSWKHHNDFTIPAGPTVAVLDSTGFDGYCREHGSIVAHTDDGDYVGILDRGDGNWNASTKLTFIGK